MLNHKYEVTDKTAALRSELDQLIAVFDRNKKGLNRHLTHIALTDLVRFWDSHRSQVRFIVYDEPLPPEFDQVVFGKLDKGGE